MSPSTYLSNPSSSRPLVVVSRISYVSIYPLISKHLIPEFTLSRELGNPSDPVTLVISGTVTTETNTRPAATAEVAVGVSGPSKAAERLPLSRGLESSTPPVTPVLSTPTPYETNIPSTSTKPGPVLLRAEHAVDGTNAVPDVEAGTPAADVAKPSSASPAQGTPTTPTPNIAGTALNETSVTSIEEARLRIVEADDAFGGMKFLGGGLAGVAEAVNSAPDKVDAPKDVYATWESVVKQMKWVMDVVDGIAEVCAVSTPLWTFLKPVFTLRSIRMLRWLGVFFLSFPRYAL